MAGVTIGAEIVQITRLKVRFISDGLEQTRREQGRSSTEVWRRIQRLGQGGFATVHLERYDAPNGHHQLRAVKQLRKDVGGGKIDYRRELEAAALFSHGKYQDSFVQSFGWYETTDHVFLTMEYLELGDLSQQMNRRFPEAETNSIIYQVLIALEYMHERDFIHRDLKPANILICRLGPDWWIKVADFGISKRALDSDTTLRTQIGSPRYGAPEVWMDGKPYTRAVDIWSVGIITYGLLTAKDSPFASNLGRYYFHAEDFPSQGVIKDGVGEEAVAFIARLLASNPESRPGATECLQLEWMAAANDTGAQSSSKELESGLLPYSDTRSWSPDPEEYISGWTTVEERPHAATMLQPSVKEGTRPSSNLDNSPRSITVNSDLQFTMSVANILPQVTDASEGDERGGHVSAQAGASAQMTLWKVLEGHTNLVRSVAFSPQGRLLASASADRTVRLWNAADGTHVRLIDGVTGHSGRKQVNCVAFAPNGATFASGSTDKTIRIWDSATGAKVACLRGHEAAVECIAFAPDGRLLASGSEDNSIRLWHPTTGALQKTLEYHKDSIISLAFSPDGRRLVSSSEDGTVRLWNPLDGSHEKMATGHLNKECPVTFSPIDSALLVVAWFYGTVQLLDTTTGKTRQLLHSARDVRAMAFSPNGSKLALAAEMTIQLWNVDTGGALLQILEGHTSNVSSVSWSPDGEVLASASWDKTVRLWRASV